MATAAPLMPKATAVWLVDNTALSFDQIAEFCKLHPLEVKAIADGDAAQGIKGLDPILTGQLTREEIAKAEADPEHRLQLTEPKVAVPTDRTRQEGPALYAGVAPPGPAERDPVAGAQPSGTQGRAIMRLVGTTKSTIASIRDRTHWNSRQPVADGSGDARPCLADRPRSRGAARQQGKAGAGRYRRNACCPPPRPPRARRPSAAAAAEAGEKAGGDDSTSARCSPSSSSSAARATRTRNKRG